MRVVGGFTGGLADARRAERFPDVPAGLVDAGGVWGVSHSPVPRRRGQPRDNHKILKPIMLLLQQQLLLLLK